MFLKIFGGRIEKYGNCFLIIARSVMGFSVLSVLIHRLEATTIPII